MSINHTPNSAGAAPPNAPTTTSVRASTPAPRLGADDPAPAPPSGTGQFFDDFDYTCAEDPRLAQRQWTPRSYAGGPGVSGATWDKHGISFPIDPANANNRLLQLASSTDGTSANTRHSELYQTQRFFEGTYASRVRFSDGPVEGPDGDQIVQSFFTITPLAFDLDPNYGELDFEYLPNGGWGAQGPIIYMTTWETYRNEPWLAENTHTSIGGSFDGWHTFVIQVYGGEVKYYIDGGLVAIHGGRYYPETPMSINYNLWFISGGLLESATTRSYQQQVDWIYHSADEVLTPAQVDQRVTAYRASAISFRDTIATLAPV